MPHPRIQNGWLALWDELDVLFQDGDPVRISVADSLPAEDVFRLLEEDGISGVRLVSWEPSDASGVRIGLLARTTAYRRPPPGLAVSDDGQEDKPEVIVCNHADRPKRARGLCATCYQKQRRRNLGVPRSGAAPKGQGDQVTVRCSRELKRQMQCEAERLGVDEAELWRRAARNFLSPPASR